MKTNFRLLALLLSLVMLLTACTTGGNTETTTTDNASEITTEAPTQEETKTEKETEKETETEVETQSYRETISRSREEMEAMLTITDDIFKTAEDQLKAFEDLALKSEDYDAVDALYQEFEDSYYFISTQVSISNIIYYMDMDVTEASDRYQNLFDKYGDVYNLYAESCKNVYNNSPIRDELFADWTEEEIKEMLAYDPETLELTKENEAILIELNALSDKDFYNKSAELYVKLVTNNNKLAKLAGYENYYDYASKEVYGRDYGRAEVETFCSLTQEYFVSSLDRLYNGWYNSFSKLSQKDAQIMIDYLYEPFDKLSENYLQNYVNSFEGSMKEGMSHMFENRNMVFTNASNSHPSAFQTYLHDLEMPFCLFGKDGQATSTIVHEMGHYYASVKNNDLNNLDLLETHSQGNEMLLLEFMRGELPKSVFYPLRGYNLYLYVVQSIACVIIDEFEREVYALESVEGYTSKEFDAIMNKVCEKYGGIDYVKNNITDMNMYWRQVATNNPVYYISYAVSMTEALNILSAVSANRETGREIYRILVEDVTPEDRFLGAMEKAGLTSPFVKETFEGIMKLAPAA